MCEHKEVLLMTQIGMRDLKEHMGRFVFLLKRGKPVMLKYRGRPLAVVRSLAGRKTGLTKEEKHIAMLERKGLVSGGNGHVRGTVRPIKIGGKSISDLVIESRE